MNKKNIVLLGASNSRVLGGLQAGLDQENVNLTNLSIGGTTSLHKLYCLKRKENQEILDNADLIILEVNIMDISITSCLNLEKICLHISYLYDELVALKRKILVLILFDPKELATKEGRIINNLHRTKANEYNFNIIDVASIINVENLHYFFLKPDPYHILSSIMQKLGQNIANNIDCFLESKIDKKYDLDFKIIEPNLLYQIKGEKLKCKINRDFFYNETSYAICSDMEFKIPPEYEDYYFIGMHTFNEYSKRIKNIKDSFNKMCFSYSSLTFKNSISILSKPCRAYNFFTDIAANFKIDTNTILYFNEANNLLEKTWEVFLYKDNINTLDSFNLVSLFLLKEYKNVNINYSFLENFKVQINNKYNFSHLVPDLLLIKESIEEYNAKMDPIKFESLQKQIQNVIKDKNASLSQIAKSRIQNQLSYKLGQAMIVNSKSFLGYIRMPFVLSYIKDKHKQEQKIYQEKIKKDPSLKLPPLEQYSDYQEALKEKQCFTYKLGQALIKANKTWYGGGYIKLLFEIRKLKKEFKKK
ncbi:SGNH/GDSL hydrolase family protein [Campylobacter lari]|uniref:hypothetical protein n=1 Tax=Campylobacter lari TaxID=201 RepID=UPI00126D2DD6|nr:SGNH/GDSL hydrolase family protein [Campylobacter lari]EAL2459689.1 SGNH/GDSL hydrolase family protein [Campylobacter lari]